MTPDIFQQFISKELRHRHGKQLFKIQDTIFQKKENQLRVTYRLKPHRSIKGWSKNYFATIAMPNRWLVRWNKVKAFPYWLSAWSWYKFKIRLLRLLLIIRPSEEREKS